MSNDNDETQREGGRRSGEWMLTLMGVVGFVVGAACVAIARFG